MSAEWTLDFGSNGNTVTQGLGVGIKPAAAISGGYNLPLRDIAVRMKDCLNMSNAERSACCTCIRASLRHGSYSP
jgi:hypothetical protein